MGLTIACCYTGLLKFMGISFSQFLFFLLEGVVHVVCGMWVVLVIYKK
jgi:hypothetical protein